MSTLNLAEFQLAAVKHIAERLRDRAGSKRFLLADEVGLGKTKVAAGVIEELAKRKRSPLTVVYLCSNAEIAEQNRTRLVAGAGERVGRVSELAVKSAHPKGDVRLYAFTPGTSLRHGTGIAWERKLLLFLMGRALQRDSSSSAWRSFFRCAVQPNRWKAETQPHALEEEFGRKTSVALQSALKTEWRKARVGGAGLLDVLDEAVATFDDTQDSHRRRRNEIVRTLRAGLQSVALEHIDADLVILDEVQRFRDVLDQSSNELALERRLFASRETAVLILSATPYRLLTLDDEIGEDGRSHHDDFFATLRFLFRHDEAPVAEIKSHLAAFRARLEEGKLFQGRDEELLRLKNELQSQLKLVVSRTERNLYVDDQRKGVEEHGLHGDAAAVHEPPSSEELVEFFRLRRFLREHEESAASITEYWKSTPAMLTFMDSGYALVKHIRARKMKVPRALLADDADLDRTAERSHRYRCVLRQLFGSGQSATARIPLWMRPTYTYYEDQFYREDDPKKLLVFSRWRFVPKSLSILLSREADRRLRAYVDESDAQPLRLAASDGRLPTAVLDVAMPAPVLAKLITLGAVAGADMRSVERIEQEAERQLEQLLEGCDVEIADTGAARPWQVIARLERVHGNGHLQHALALAARESRRDEESAGFEAQCERLQEWLASKEPLRFSRARLRKLARIALYSPAVGLTRALEGDGVDGDPTLLARLVAIGLGPVRAYFNRTSARAIIDRHAKDTARKSRESYSQRVLRYCRDAHLQAVLDEWLHLVAESADSSSRAEACLEAIESVLGLGAGSPSTNGFSGGGADVTLEPEKHRHSTAFATAFVEARHDDDPHGGSASARRSAVRRSFNSPFWPFVLATTSIGQEGLDFHLYCRDVVHWNLPSNPVDLEQREGRINRRNGLAVRRSIAAEWSLSRVVDAEVGERALWDRVFAAVSKHPGPQRYKHGLYPHWIYECEDPSKTARIRRHLPFHPLSEDAQRYGRLKRALTLYRLVFGQPRQQDLLERLQQSVERSDGEPLLRSLPAYMLNLSPFAENHALQRAQDEADEILRDPSVVKLKALVDAVNEMRVDSRFAARLQNDIELLGLLDHVRAIVEDTRGPTAHTARAVAALVYLRNPYDTEFDAHGDPGLDDDIAVIRAAHALLRSPQHSHST